MSFYSSQVSNKSSRYCSSNLYGSNLSTVYADEPPPLDDTPEEDDGEIVFRDKNPKKQAVGSNSKFDNDKSGNVTVESEPNPWSKSDSSQKHVADDDFGGFSGFADFSSAFAGNSKSQNESSWFKNGDNVQSSVTNFNHNLPSHQGQLSASPGKSDIKNEGSSSKDDDFGCFSGGDDSDFDDFSSFTSGNQITPKETSQVNEISERNNTTKSSELFKNGKTIHLNNSSSQNAKNSNLSSDDDFDEFCLSGSTSPTDQIRNTDTPNSPYNSRLSEKATCFSDDDDENIGDFNSSGFDDDSGETVKSPDLIINSEQTNSSPQQESSKDNLHSDLRKSNTSPSNTSGKGSEHCLNESEDHSEAEQLSKQDHSNMDVKKDSSSITGKNENSTNVDQSNQKTNQKGEYNDEDFGDFGRVVPSTEEKPMSNGDDDDIGEDDDIVSPLTEQLQVIDVVSPRKKEHTSNDDDDDFGDFGAVVPSTGEQPMSNGDDDDDDFGDFGVIAASSSSNNNDYVASLMEEKPMTKNSDGEFGDFGVAASLSNNEKPKSENVGVFGVFPLKEPSSSSGKNDGDEFGHFGAATPSSEYSNKDNFGDFAEIEEPNFKGTTFSEPSSLEIKIPSSSNDDDNGFGQFDSPLSKTNDGDFADFKSTGNTSAGFMSQISTASSFSTTSVSQSNKDNQQEQLLKMSGAMKVIKPQRNRMLSRISNPIKQCFINNDVATENKVIVQLIEHEVQSEGSRMWPQLLTIGRDGSLRFDWVLSQHQIKMLEGLSMLPVKIQTSVSFRPGGQIPTPLFASSMGLLEPVKGVITPFYHPEEINPSQDPFGAPPEVGVQDLGFDKGSKKESLQLHHVHTEAKDNISDTISVSSSLDLDFLAPSNTNSESTKTVSRGLFEDDLLGLGMKFTASPKSQKQKGQNNLFKFNSTTMSLATNDDNLSEKAKTAVKDFEDLSFMLSKVLMFPLKSQGWN